MAFADIVCDIDYMRAGNDDVLLNNSIPLTDSELTELFYYNAYKDLDEDLRNALKLPETDTENIDLVYLNNTNFLKKALTIKQLIYFYLRNNDGVNSMSWVRLKNYESQYKSMLSKFATLQDVAPTKPTKGIMGRVQLG